MASPPTDHYDVLDLRFRATENDIKKAYRKLVLLHHPDKGGDPAKFREVKESYDVLMDAEKRRTFKATWQDWYTEKEAAAEEDAAQEPAEQDAAQEPAENEAEKADRPGRNHNLCWILAAMLVGLVVMIGIFLLLMHARGVEAARAEEEAVWQAATTAEKLAAATRAAARLKLEQEAAQEVAWAAAEKLAAAVKAAQEKSAVAANLKLELWGRFEKIYWSRATASVSIMSPTRTHGTDKIEG